MDVKSIGHALRLQAVRAGIDSVGEVLTEKLG
jgi:hypothetical protein